MTCFCYKMQSRHRSATNRVSCPFSNPLFHISAILDKHIILTALISHDFNFPVLHFNIIYYSILYIQFIDITKKWNIEDWEITYCYCMMRCPPTFTKHLWDVVVVAMVWFWCGITGCGCLHWHNSPPSFNTAQHVPGWICSRFCYFTFLYGTSIIWYNLHQAWLVSVAFSGSHRLR